MTLCSTSGPIATVGALEAGSDSSSFTEGFHNLRVSTGTKIISKFSLCTQNVWNNFQILKRISLDHSNKYGNVQSASTNENNAD